MRPCSPRFLESLRGPHTVVSTVELRFPTGELVEVPLEGGSVTLDRTAPVRRSGSVSIPWALEAGADLGVDLRTLPLGGYATLRRGLRYADGTLELVLLGVLRVESVSWNTLEAAASLELADRMAQVRDEPFTSPFAPPGGVGYQQNGTLTDGSPVVATAPTTALLVGMTVTGPGVPAGRKIASIQAGTGVTLDGPANTVGYKDGRMEAGNSVISELSDTTDLSIGMRVTGGGLPAGTIIARIDSEHEIAVTANAPADVVGVRFDFNAPQPSPLTFGQGRRIADGAVEIVAAVFGNAIAYRKIHDPPIILDDVYLSENRATSLAELARAAAGEQYFDAAGDYVFDVPSGTGEPVWTIDAGARGVLVNADEGLDRTGVYNGVLVTGQSSSTSAPVSALVVDDDPSSPTRWGGPFGKVARLEQSTAVPSAEAAADAAAALLDRAIGLQRSLTLTSSPNPALEPGDVVEVGFPDGRVETHAVDVIRLDLGPAGAQSLATRSTVFAGADRVALPPGPRRARPFPARPRRRRVLYGRDAWRELGDRNPPAGARAA